MRTVTDVKQTDKNTLETIRQQLGLTQEEMAKIIGISRRSLIRYENKEREPIFTIKQFKALVQKLREIGIEIDDLPDSLIS